MITRTRKRIKYRVNTGNGMEKSGDGWTNFCEFELLAHAKRYLKTRFDGAQIDLVGGGVKNPRCLYYKQDGKVKLNPKPLVRRQLKRK
jgi:hypothetical protein